MYEIEQYVAEDGTSPFAEWLEGVVSLDVV
jgi:hypothetical protein